MKRSWWNWALGLLLLAAFCDDDDDRRSRNCYEFGNGETRCFADPLPEGKFCYIDTVTTVRCYDQPQP